MAALVGLILFLRRPDALLHPQFFAEDGMFFLDAYDRGPLAFLTPYNGYLHTVPRLTAWFALACFDPRWMPAVFNGVALAAWLAIALALFSPRIGLPAKPALALALVLVPHTGEVFLSLTNVIWPLAVGLVLLLIADDADTSLRRVFDSAAALLCGLTGPFSVFLLPLFVLRAFVRRSRESLVLAITVGLAASVQGALIVHSRALFFRPTPRDPRALLSAMGGRLYGTFFGGYGLPRFESGPAWIAAGLGLTALAGWAACRPGPWRQAQMTLAGAWLCLALPVAVKFLREPGLISAPIDGDRYFFLPHVLLAWLLLVFSVRFGGWTRPLLLTALAAALLANLAAFRVEPLPDDRWAQSVQPIREGKGFSIPINPDGWVVQSAGRNSRR